MGLVLKNLTKLLPKLFQVLLIAVLLTGQVTGIVAASTTVSIPIETIGNIDTSVAVMSVSPEIMASDPQVLPDHNHSAMTSDTANHCIDATDCEACVFCSAVFTPFQLIASATLSLFHDQSDPHFPRLFLDIPKTPPILFL